MFLPTGGNACTADPVDGFADYQLAESSEGGAIEIDGELVSGCWVADFGAACTPYLMGLNAAITNSPVCGDDCGGVCQQCAATSDSEVLLFYGAALDRLQLRTRMPLSVGTTAGAGFTGTPRPDVRYLVACRPACGPAGYNVAVGPFTLGN